MKKTLLILCLLFLVAGTSYAVPIQWSENGNYYEAISAGYMNWTDPNGGFVVEFDTAPVPEPSTILLLGCGIAGLVGRRKFKK